MKETRRLLKVVGELRRKCPWDKKQTHRSLRPYLLEEAYEAMDAIESRKSDALQEELGDLLLQVALHSEIASEKSHFDFERVAKGIADKMIRRHPHIYKRTSWDLKDHMKNWTRLKNEEKPKRGALEGIPKALPSLQRAQRYGEIAGSVGFDWESSEQVFKKVREELKELETEVKKRKPNRERVADELGDLFFTLANLARHLGIDAEGAARQGAQKFADRYTRMEKRMRGAGRELTELEPAELEKAWEKVKRP